MSNTDILFRREMRTSLLALLGMAVTAGVAHANDVEPRQASATVASPNLTNIIRSDCADSTGSPWSSLGIATRPSWVNLCTERRLRILPSLPAIAQSITADANNYFGTKGPGLAVGLVLEDGLYYSQGFGFVDAGKSKHPDEDTVFRAGSLSKVITGTALLTLIDDPTRTPALSLEDDADAPRYLPELKYVCPLGKGRCKRGSSSLGIKLKHLVSHTAGLPNVMEQTNANIDPWLTDLKKSFTIFSPGEYSAYSGVSAEAIGLIEQRVSKAPSYVAFVTDSLFKPLGMTHSSMDQKDVSANLLAQRWMFGVNGNSWSFVPDNAIIPGDDQAMILPAGGLATSIGDLARFMRMWISGVAPVVNGHSLLKKATLQAANLPQVNVGTKPPASCGATPDTNGFSYRGCGPANAFGVNWYVGSMPFIEHNGDEPGRSGSETMIDAPAKMGATGLVSTEPYPSVNPQPAGLDGSFIDTVVSTRLMNGGLQADTATTWTGSPLSSGVARLLWLSGTEAPKGVGGVIDLPGPIPTIKSDPKRVPALPPGYVAAGPGKAEPAARRAYQDVLLAQFTPTFATKNALLPTNVEAFISKTFGDARFCSTFRVRQVASTTQVAVRLECRLPNQANVRKTFDATLSVDSSTRIAGLTAAGPSTAAY